MGAKLRTPWGETSYVLGTGVPGVVWAKADKGAGLVVGHPQAQLLLSGDARGAAVVQGPTDVTYCYRYANGAWAVVAWELPEIRRACWKILRSKTMRADPTHYLRLILNAGQQDYLRRWSPEQLLPAVTVCALVPMRTPLLGGCMVVRTADQRNWLVSMTSYSLAARRKEADMLITDLEVVAPLGVLPFGDPL
jgi:hypothetical protein